MMNVFKNKAGRNYILASIVLVMIVGLIIGTHAAFSDRVMKEAVIKAATFSKDGYTLERSISNDPVTAGEIIEVVIRESNAKDEVVTSSIKMTGEWVSSDTGSDLFENESVDDNISLFLDGEELFYTVNEDGLIEFELPTHELAAGKVLAERKLSVYIPDSLVATGELFFEFDHVRVAQFPHGFINDFTKEEINAVQSIGFSTKVVWAVGKGGTKDLYAYLLKTLDGDYSLKFEGSGEMTDFELDCSSEDTVSWSCMAPWSSYQSEIFNIIFSDDMETIGMGAFVGFESLETICIPENINSIGSHAFTGTVSLKEVCFDHSSNDEIRLPKAGADSGAFYVDDNLETKVISNNPTVSQYDWAGDHRAVALIRVPVSLEMVSPPNKTIYVEGENFNEDGMVIEVIYKDGLSKVIDRYEIEKGENLALDQEKVILSYEENGIELELSILISVVPPTPVLASSDTWYMANTPKSSITEICFVDSYEITGDEIESWDASEDEDGSVIAYITGSTLTLAGNGTGTIVAHENSDSAFSHFTNVSSFNGFELLDMECVSDMSSFFKGCESLIEVDVSSFDTGNVNEMDQLFEGCSKLERIDLSAWDMGEVTTTSYMFSECSTLEQVILPDTMVP